MDSIVKIVQPSGILGNEQASKLRKEIVEIVESGARLILVDLQSVTFIDSSGLGVLAMAFKAVRTAGGRLCFCSVSEQPRMLFELTGMEQVFEVFADRSAFDKTVASSSF
ncbi:MAG TPA: STAS domain-containing protein [Thermosynechococcaceae cyanobacterium]